MGKLTQEDQSQPGLHMKIFSQHTHIIHTSHTHSLGKAWRHFHSIHTHTYACADTRVHTHTQPG